MLDCDKVFDDFTHFDETLIQAVNLFNGFRITEGENIRSQPYNIPMLSMQLEMSYIRTST